MCPRVVVLIVLLWTSTAVAAPNVHNMDFPGERGGRTSAVVQGELFGKPCARWGVPPALAVAIAMQESSLYPWAVNIEGKAIHPRTRDEALALLRQAEAERRSYDVGLMQVNSYWLRKYRFPLETVLDPASNVTLGVWILAQEIQRHGLNWRAVASYHTPIHRNPERGKDYAQRVMRHLAKLQGARND